MKIFHNRIPSLGQAAVWGVLTFFVFFIGPANVLAATGKTILRIHGSNTIGAELMPDLAIRFMKKRGYQFITREAGAREREYFIVGVKNNDIHRIEIQAHGSSIGFKSLGGGTCDIGMASRRIKEEEARVLASLGDMTDIRNEHILAIDGTCVIVNQSNRIGVLDMDQLREIFTGRITNWAQVGGENSPITLYARDNQSGTYDTFKTMVLKQSPLAGTARRYKSNTALSGDISMDPNGIGFVSMSYVLKSKALAIKKAADSPEIEAGNLTVACEDYPLARRFYLYASAKVENALVKAFIDYALSEEGQSRVAMKGFSKLSMDMDDVEVNIGRFMAPGHNLRYKNETLSGRRVNFNFRFTESGSLENRSQKDLERLIIYIQQPNQKYYELVLMGINSCTHASGVGNTIIEQIGAGQFHVLPQIVCLDNVTTREGKPWKPVIEVWLRTVDDGA